MKLIFIAIILPMAAASAHATASIGQCFTGLHCSDRSSTEALKPGECLAALSEEGLDIGSWRAVHSKICRKIRAKDVSENQNCRMIPAGGIQSTDPAPRGFDGACRYQSNSAQQSTQDSGRRMIPAGGIQATD